MHAGFIGLGHLGRAIANRLLECGHTLTVWNRTPSRAAGMDVQAAGSAAAVADGAGIIFLCLFDSSAVESVLTQGKGLLSGDISGKIIVDLSTNHFAEVTAFHELCSRAGVDYLEAPVLGSVVPASQGALTVLVSGNKEAYEAVRPVLGQVGNQLFFLGKPGLATRMKLINNLVLGTFMATLAEALVFGEEVGVGKQEVLDILQAGAGNSLVLNAKKDKLLTEDFSAHFSNALIYKDLHCLQDLAYELKKPLLTGSAVKELFARTYGAGIEEQDFSAVYTLLKKG